VGEVGDLGIEHPTVASRWLLRQVLVVVGSDVAIERYTAAGMIVPGCISDHIGTWPLMSYDTLLLVLWYLRLSVPFVFYFTAFLLTHLHVVVVTILV
jgi:hypothetical protein